ncbi:MAG: adenine phosphoribosyltransferase [Anaerolineae bacterium]|nr:adenine phosphoribosyltransferase [Gemmatimonadaceae bacterium]
MEASLRAGIRDVPDFPSPGIVFKDISPLLANAPLFRRATDVMAETWRPVPIDMVVAIESRGFLFGAPLAQVLGVGLVPIRKKGKLPFRTCIEDYALEYGTGSLEIHIDAIKPGATALIVDDVLATGGTAAAACRLVERLGGRVAGCSFLIALTFLPGRQTLAGRRVEAILDYES